MFDPAVYRARREALRRSLDGGLVLLVGHGEAAMNYADNTYPFVQEGSFAYFFGLRHPDLVGVIDADGGEDTLFGQDMGLEDLVWHGPTPSLSERAASAGVSRTGDPAALQRRLRAAQAGGQAIHFPPPFRGKTVLKLADLLGQSPAQARAGASQALIRAIVALRELKGPEELAEMEAALEITAEMHLAAMAHSRPGVVEYEVVAEIERVARRHDSRLAYPAIFSRSGEVLHNNDHSQTLRAGDLVINDTGACGPEGYASDITRTLPIGGRFEGRSRALYEIVLASQLAGIEAAKPGTPFVDVHKTSMRVLVEGLAAFGVFQGDPAEVVGTGAYAVVCQAGLGHQIGLDVHDMEGLGEDLVGYGAGLTRSPLFGLNRLRLAKPLEAGMTVTVEPGLYFIAPLIEAWASENRHAGMINYARLRDLIGAGGLRIEDDVVITGDGARVLGPPIPKTVAEVEAAMGV